ncbi:MAG TPA: hypothetical protein VFY16_09095 [Gemmatimonadaceae bacterium]|nr:hypothetical protein [Gemmatimonadaceae bacterium]
MISPSQDVGAALGDAVAEYRAHANVAQLLKRLDHLASSATPDALVVAVEPYRDIPEVAGPIYERVVAEQPGNARALVILANAYWLSGRGPEVVGELASRALAADPENRGAWHLWAITESDPRQRVARWQQVVSRFPDDQLAQANLADNAASLAGAEHDGDALVLSIATYERLLERAVRPEEREALEHALLTLRAWKL